jgi:hypothetical protein
MIPTRMGVYLGIDTLNIILYISAESLRQPISAESLDRHLKPQCLTRLCQLRAHELVPVSLTNILSNPAPYICIDRHRM